jgi:hypothetical protein
MEQWTTPQAQLAKVHDAFEWAFEGAPVIGARLVTAFKAVGSSLIVDPVTLHTMVALRDLVCHFRGHGQPHLFDRDRFRCHP